MGYDNTGKGAGWIKPDKNGDKYISAKVNIDGVDHSINIYKNKYKKEAKHPDYNLLVLKPKSQDIPASAITGEDEVPF